MINVIKFGGTSVADKKAVISGVGIVQSMMVDKLIVVVSALSGVTNKIEQICEYLENKQFAKTDNILDSIESIHIAYIKELEVSEECEKYLSDTIEYYRRFAKAIETLGDMTPRLKDIFYSMGEMLSSRIITQVYKKQGVKAEYLDIQNMIVTDSNFNSAKVNIEITKSNFRNKTNELFENFNCLVCGGFIASDENGDTTTLGRGGSDHSAAVIAMAVNANSLGIYTDVSGIMTADPRIVHNTQTIKELSYLEASELAISGAKVLHPKTIAPALQADIPVRVMNTFDNKNKGTLITSNISKTGQIKAIAIKNNISIVKIQISEDKQNNSINHLLKILKNIDFEYSTFALSNDTITISFVQSGNMELFETAIKEYASFDIIEGNSIISCVGSNICTNILIQSQILSELKKEGVPVNYSMLSDMNFRLFVPEKFAKITVNSIHKLYFDFLNK